MVFYFIIGLIFIGLYFYYPKTTILILAFSIYITISFKQVQRKEEKLLLSRYLEYCEDMKEKGNTKSYEEFKSEKLIKDAEHAKVERETMKITENNSTNNKKYLADHTRGDDSASNVPKCPTCGSQNVEKIPTVVKVFFLGPFAPLYRTFKCNNCGYQW